MHNGRSRSSKVIDIYTIWKLSINFLLVINGNFGRILHRCRDFDAWSSKFARFAYPTLFEAPLRENSLEFRDETYPRKTRGMGLLYGENSVILASTVFDWSTVWQTDGRRDGRTDGIVMAYTRYSIYAVARKNDTLYAEKIMSAWKNVIS